MKKMLVLALAMIAFSAQSNAAPGRDKVDGRGDVHKIDDARDRAARDGAAHPGQGHIADALRTAGLDSKLSADDAHKLQLALSNPHNGDLQKAATEIIALNKAKPALADLSRSRVEGLMHLSKIDPRLRQEGANSALPEDKAKEAYASLVLNAGKQAANWTKGTQELMEKVLKTANTELSRGKSYDAAMNDALTELKTSTKSDKKVSELMEELKRLCKA